MRWEAIVRPFLFLFRKRTIKVEAWRYITSIVELPVELLHDLLLKEVKTTRQQFHANEAHELLQGHPPDAPLGQAIFPHYSTKPSGQV